MLSDPTLFAAGTPASPSATPAGAMVPTTPATSGPISPGAFAYYDPGGHCLRTCQGTLDLGLTECSPTLPPSGSMRSGNCYQQQPLVPRTSATDCSSWPTPNARDHKDTGPNVGWEKVAAKSKLAGAVMWPTPMANDSTLAMWPTPKSTPSGPDYARRDREGSG